MGIEYTEEQLRFYKKAYRIVRREYEENGIEGRLLLLIEYTTNGREWKEFYSGVLEFSTYRELRGEETTADVNVGGIGAQHTLRNRNDVKVDLDSLVGLEGAQLPPYAGLGKAITVPSKTVLLTNRAELEPEDLDFVTDYTSGGSNKKTTFKIPFGNDNLNEIEVFDTLPTFKAIGNDNNGADEPIFINKLPFRGSSGKTKFNVKGRINITFDGFSDSLTLYVLVLNADDSVADKIKNATSIPKMVGALGYTTIDFEKDLLLSKGQKIVAYAEMMDNYAYGGGDILVFRGTYIEIKAESVSKPTDVRQYMIHDTLCRIAEIITNGEMTVKSDFYGRTDSPVHPTAVDGPGALRSITNGYLMRSLAAMQDGSRPPMTIGWMELMRSLMAIDAVGYSFDMANKVVRVEPLEYFYNDEVVLRCLDIDSIERETDMSRCYNELNVGYEKWEAEEWNGIDGFHGKRQYLNRIKNHDAKLEKYSKLIADGYAIEATRRRGMIEPTKDWRYDNSYFVLDLKRSGSDFAVNAGSVSNGTLVDPSTVLNVELSPARMAARWFGVVMQACNNVYGGDALTYAAAEGYAGAKTTSNKSSPTAQGEVAENQSWALSQIAKDSRPRVKPEIVKFKYPISLKNIAKIRANPYGLIEFERGGEVGYGYILEMEFDISEWLGNFTLMTKY
jgi:hypothetical protein